MMANMRTKHTPEFKAKVALAAFKEDKTLKNFWGQVLQSNNYPRYDNSSTRDGCRGDKRSASTASELGYTPPSKKEFEEIDMPTISMFYGILICMYFYDDERHNLPHIHAKYQGQEASFSILDGSCLDGVIPQTKFRLVQAWIEIHRESLLADWELAISGQSLLPIDPLR